MLKKTVFFMLLFPSLLTAETFEVVEDDFKLASKNQGYILKTINDKYKFAIREVNKKKHDYLYVINFLKESEKNVINEEFLVIPIKKNKEIKKGYTIDKKGVVLERTKKINILNAIKPKNIKLIYEDNFIILPNERMLTIYKEFLNIGDSAYFKSNFEYEGEIIESYGFGKFDENGFCVSYDYLEDGSVHYYKGERKNPKIGCFKIEEGN